CGARDSLRRISSAILSLKGFPRSLRMGTGLLFVITTAISNGSVWAPDFGVGRARYSRRNLRTRCSIQFSDVGGNSPAMSLVPAREEFYAFSRLCVAEAISPCWLI